jgi:hypothetical protein
MQKQDHELTLVIETSQGEWESNFPKTYKVSEVIAAIIKHFGFSGEGKYQLKLSNGETMNPERPLVSYHLKDGDHLTFVDLGVAV